MELTIFLFSGLGEVLAGGAFGIFGQFLSIKRKTPIIILGFVCCITAYILIFINIPKESPFGETDIIEHVSFIGKGFICWIFLGRERIMGCLLH